MGSINTNGTTWANSWLGIDDFPAGPWTYSLWARVGYVDPSVNFASGIMGNLTADFNAWPAYNMRNNDLGIRYGSFNSDYGYLSSVEQSDDVWAYYVISSDGGSSDINFSVLIDGEFVIENHNVPLSTFGGSTSDLLFMYLGTTADGSFAHNPLLLTSIKIYKRNLWTSGAGSGADLIAQSRTRTTLFPADLYAAWDWDGSTTSGINVSTEGSHTFENWVDTGIATSTSQPSFPDDGARKYNAILVGSCF